MVIDINLFWQLFGYLLLSTFENVSAKICQIVDPLHLPHLKDEYPLWVFVRAIINKMPVWCLLCIVRLFYSITNKNSTLFSQLLFLANSFLLFQTSLEILAERTNTPYSMLSPGTTQYFHWSPSKLVASQFYFGQLSSLYGRYFSSSPQGVKRG